MGRYPGPLVKHDLSRLQIANGRDVALNSLKCCVKQLEPESITFFLDQIAEAHQQDTSRPYVISLYEDVARAHRSLLLPYIPRIMEALVRALSESASSLHVHEACAKVVVVISLHCIDFERHAKEVLRLICEPLLFVLVNKFEPLASGSAVCLKALVQSRNWCHAPLDLVDEIGYRVVCALRSKSSRSMAHILLACALTRSNRDVISSFDNQLLSVGKDILQQASSPWTLRVGAAQLLNAVMSVTDGYAHRAEIEAVIEVLEKFRADRMRKVRLAVMEALKTARTFCFEGAEEFAPQIPADVPTLKVTVKAPPSRSSQSPPPRRPSMLVQDRTTKDVSTIRIASSSTQQYYEQEVSPEVVAFDFAVMETDPESQRRSSSMQSNKRDTSRNIKRATVTAEPGGYVIQEWIRVGDVGTGRYMEELGDEVHDGWQTIGFEKQRSATVRVIEELDPNPTPSIHDLTEEETKACTTENPKEKINGENKYNPENEENSVENNNNSGIASGSNISNDGDGVKEGNPTSNIEAEINESCSQEETITEVSKVEVLSNEVEVMLQTEEVTCTTTVSTTTTTHSHIEKLLLPPRATEATDEGVEGMLQCLVNVFPDRVDFATPRDTPCETVAAAPHEEIHENRNESVDESSEDEDEGDAMCPMALVMSKQPQKQSEAEEEEQQIQTETEEEQTSVQQCFKNEREQVQTHKEHQAEPDQPPDGPGEPGQLQAEPEQQVQVEHKQLQVEPEEHFQPKPEQQVQAKPQGEVEPEEHFQPKPEQQQVQAKPQRQHAEVQQVQRLPTSNVASTSNQQIRHQHPRRLKRQKWTWSSGLQRGMELLVGGSVCALVALPAVVAVLKCLEPSSTGCSVPT